MLNSFATTALVALLGLSSLVTAQIVPATCTATPYTTTIVRTYTAVVTTSRVLVTTRPHSCYTGTITRPAPMCPGGPSNCITLDCIVLTTATAPCKDACCPKTPTVVVTPSCTTTCRGGCAMQTFTTTLSSGCPTAVPNPPGGK